jgi:hypothetical protein
LTRTAIRPFILLILPEAAAILIRAADNLNSCILSITERMLPPPVFCML